MPVKKPFVFFDLDNTLLDFDWAERRALSAAFLEQGIEPRPELLERYSQINKLHWEMLENGLLTREEVLLKRFQALFEEKGMDAPAETISRRYEELLSYGYRYLPGAERLLETLHGSCALYLASNGSASVQAARIESSGIGRFFDGIFISEELGADKPSLAYFERCFARIPGFDPALAIMVGDSLTSDIRGGIRAGLKTCWYNPSGREPNHDIRPDHEIRTLGELPALLKRVFQTE